MLILYKYSHLSSIRHEHLNQNFIRSHHSFIHYTFLIYYSYLLKNVLYQMNNNKIMTSIMSHLMSLIQHIFFYIFFVFFQILILCQLLSSLDTNISNCFNSCYKILH